MGNSSEKREIVMATGRGKSKSNKPPARQQAQAPERSHSPLSPLRAPTNGPRTGKGAATIGGLVGSRGVGSPMGWVIVPSGPGPSQGAPRDGNNNVGTVPSVGHTPDGLTTGGSISHVKTQTSVGGTTGTPKPVDRSEANKKAWITRKKLYGTSGRKES